MIRRTGARLAPALAALALVALPACSRHGVDPETRAAGSAPAVGSPSSGPVPAGSFGSLPKVCGSGSPAGSPGRGVTAGEINISTLADPGNAFAPGLGQETFDVANAFVAWCNEAGGINGRKISLSTRDAKITDVGAKMTEACQSDFMVVGSGNVFDQSGVPVREQCALGSIPAFAISPEAAASRYQVMPSPQVAGKSNMGGPFAAVQRAHPDASRAIGTWYPDTPSVTGVVDDMFAAASKEGLQVVAKVPTPIQVDNPRPYAQQMKDAGVRLFFATAPDLGPYFTAASDVGFTQDVLMSTTAAYAPLVLEQIQQNGSPKMYVPTFYVPYELADTSPAVGQLIEIMQPVVPRAKLSGAHEAAFDAWLLWAMAATACGDDLTVDCVLAKAGAVTAWDAGGLKGPVDLSSTSPPDCFVMLRPTATGWVVDDAVTRPNAGVFNCSPQNVVAV